jgi:hypothetical protein
MTASAMFWSICLTVTVADRQPDKQHQHRARHALATPGNKRSEVTMEKYSGQQLVDDRQV